MIQNHDVVIVNGSKGAVGEDNANLVCALLIIGTQRTLHQQQRKEPDDRADTALVIDESHNVFIPSFATLLSEGRSANLEVTAAFQYTGQIIDERVKSGIKSLLQNISIFRLREFEDARAAASLAMEVFSDNIKGEQEDQRRLRLDPMDIVNSPDYRAANLWLAKGIPQPVFTASTTVIESSAAKERSRRHHEQEQRHRGYHPHDVGKYIQAPLVHDIASPVMARYRTVHIDLTGWSSSPAAQTIRRVTMLLQPSEGNPIGFVADPADSTNRRFCVCIPSDPEEVAWLPPGNYGISIIAYAADETSPQIWTYAKKVEISDEPLRSRT